MKKEFTFLNPGKLTDDDLELVLVKKIPSRKTCELAGGELVEIVDLPEHNDQYQRGERKKCRYRFDL